MRYYSRSVIFLNSIISGLLLIAGGCEKKQTNVQPGVGLPDCCVGMPIKDLKADWQPPSDSFPGSDISKSYLDNRKAGLAVYHDGIRIVGVIAYYHSETREPFSGIIDGDVGPTSSVEDVILAKGQPTNLAVTKGEEGDFTDLDYVERGIRYTFLNKKLADVVISKPLLDVPVSMKEDTGDTTAYRAIRAR